MALVHGDRYDYSAVDYVNCKTKVAIICRTHGLFYQLPTNHLKGYNCSACGRAAQSSSAALDLDTFLKKARRT